MANRSAMLAAMSLSAAARRSRHLFRSALAWATFAVMAVFLVFAHGAYAASSETAEEQARRAAEIYKTTMSPFCPGRTVDACPSPNATAWREDIRRWVGEGVSTEEIRRRLKERSDQDLSGAPSTALDAVLPIGATVVSLILLGLLLRLLVRPANSTPSPERETSATKEEGKTSTHDKVSEQELDDRLERELEQLDD